MNMGEIRALRGVSWEGSRLGRGAFGALGGLLLFTSLARAQAPDGKPAPAAPPAAPPVAAPAPPTPPTPVAPPAPVAITAPAAPAPSAAAKHLADIEARLAALEGAQQATEKDESKNLFRIYGFTDVGVQRAWVTKTSIIAPYIPATNATNFVVGNLNLYLDAQPSKDWSFLGELRFSNSPAGAFETSNSPPPAGVLARLTTGQYAHTDTTQPDGSVFFGGLVAIERAHIDWKHFDLFKVRIGQFFTPFGIYNTDHGTPVLITTKLPYLITSRMLPTRQTGLMIYGSTFVGPWELGYSAYVSNGRTDLAPLTFDDNRGFGGRISAANEQGGNMSLKFGASFYTGKVADAVVDFTLDPAGSVVANKHSTYAYREYLVGADATMDFGATRIRLEGAVNRTIYDPGMRNGGSPNLWRTTVFAIVAHRFSLLNMEPYVTGSITRTPWSFADTGIGVGGGLNFYITQAITFRSQVEQAWFLRMVGTADTAAIAPQQDVFTVMSRLIMSF